PIIATHRGKDEVARTRRDHQCGMGWGGVWHGRGHERDFRGHQGSSDGILAQPGKVAGAGRARELHGAWMDQDSLGRAGERFLAGASRTRSSFTALGNSGRCRASRAVSGVARGELYDRANCEREWWTSLRLRVLQ